MQLNLEKEKSQLVCLLQDHSYRTGPYWIKFMIEFCTYRWIFYDKIKIADFKNTFYPAVYTWLEEDNVMYTNHFDVLQTELSWGKLYTIMMNVICIF
jgi:hypothetical protein